MGLDPSWGDPGRLSDLTSIGLQETPPEVRSDADIAAAKFCKAFQGMDVVHPRPQSRPPSPCGNGATAIALPTGMPSRSARQGEAGWCPGRTHKMTLSYCINVVSGLPVRKVTPKITPGAHSWPSFFLCVTPLPPRLGRPPFTSFRRVRLLARLFCFALCLGASDWIRTVADAVRPCDSCRMRTILVEIFAGAVKIGAAQLAAWDYGMAVAGGDFRPADAYSVTEHATVVEGVRSVQLSTQLEARTTGGQKILCELLSLSDYSASVGPEGREVELFGIHLEAYFGPPT